MEEIETRIEKYKRAKLDALFGTMGRQLKEQECKIQDLITAGQGQMKRIQELERQVKALHSHRHETLVAHYGR
jgi:hypothetical protein